MNHIQTEFKTDFYQVVNSMSNVIYFKLNIRFDFHLSNSQY